MLSTRTRRQAHGSSLQLLISLVILPLVVACDAAGIRKEPQPARPTGASADLKKGAPAPRPATGRDEPPAARSGEPGKAPPGAPDSRRPSPEEARAAVGARIQAMIDRLDKACRERTIYMIGPERGQRLAALIREKKPRLVVECGTALGYSGLWIARELKALGHGRLLTFELDPAIAREAAANFEQAGAADVVEVRSGDARELVKEVRDEVDFLFLDCNFGNYHPCFKGIEGRLTDGALIVADNAGVGAAGMADYLNLVRGQYQSKTEWFDTDLPWGKRDAMEITTFQMKK